MRLKCPHGINKRKPGFFILMYLFILFYNFFLWHVTFHSNLGTPLKLNAFLACTSESVPCVVCASFILLLCSHRPMLFPCLPSLRENRKQEAGNTRGVSPRTALTLKQCSFVWECIYICVCVFIFPPLRTFWLSVSLDMWHPSDLHCLKPAHWLLFVRFTSHFRRLTSLSGLGSDTKRIWGCRVKVTHEGLVSVLLYAAKDADSLEGSSKRAQYNALYNEWNLAYRMFWQSTVHFIVVFQYAKSFRYSKMRVAI